MKPHEDIFNTGNKLFFQEHQLFHTVCTMMHFTGKLGA